MIVQRLNNYVGRSWSVAILAEALCHTPPASARGHLFHIVSRVYAHIWQYAAHAPVIVVGPSLLRSSCNGIDTRVDAAEEGTTRCDDRAIDEECIGEDLRRKRNE